MGPKPLRWWAEAAQGKKPWSDALSACADKPVQGIATDSRHVTAGQLFVALRGPRYDGHAFVQTALTAGACAAVVDEQGAQSLGLTTMPCVVVSNTQTALGAMAKAVRAQSKAKFVAITGSNGKTTSKELVAAALAGHGTLHKTAGNLNNAIGVPKTLFDLPDEAWAAVVEMGMSAPGEIAELTRIVLPHVGLITNVAQAHLEGLGTIERVAAAKCELIEQMATEATVVLNADDEALMAAAMPKLNGRRLISFGTGPHCDVQLVAVATHAATRTGVPRMALTLQIEGTRFIGTVPLVGRHNALNAAGAVAVAWALGFTPGEAVAHIERTSVPGARSRVIQAKEAGIWLLDDAYNANPGSVRAALDTLADIAGSSRQLVILGDMLELGERAAALHLSVGEYAGKSGVKHLLAVGKYADFTAQGARAAGLAATGVATLDQLWPHLAHLLQRGDWLLVKGSRGAKLERVVDAVLAGTYGGYAGIAAAAVPNKPSPTPPTGQP